ncbi:MAG: lactonase family protein [Verrucomicrobiota bacterium]
MRVIAVFGVWVALFGGLGAEVVYVASANKGIFELNLDVETGRISNALQAGDTYPAGFLAAHPERRLLFSTMAMRERNPSGAVVVYRIGKEGWLRELDAALTDGSGTCHVSLDATGEVVLAANYGTGSIASFLLKEDGTLGEAVSTHQHEGSSVNEYRQSGPHPHWIGVGPRNKFVYVPDLGMDEVVVYALNATTAELTPVSSAKVAPGAGPRHMKFSKDGKFAYVLNELNLTVTVFLVNEETGGLSEVKVVSAVPKDFDKLNLSCSEIRVHPNGKFVYCGVRDLNTRGESVVGRNSLSIFAVQEDGTLKRIHTRSALVSIPRNFGIDPTGRWLLVAGQGSDNVQVFQIGEDGLLRKKGLPVTVPRPRCIEFGASGTLPN